MMRIQIQLGSLYEERGGGTRMIMDKSPSSWLDAAVILNEQHKQTSHLESWVRNYVGAEVWFVNGCHNGVVQWVSGLH